MDDTHGVRAFLDRWAALAGERDVERYADLYVRDPAPVVTFTDGQRCADWLDVRLRLQRDFERAVIERVDVHDVVSQPLVTGVVGASFVYDLHARDMWGTGFTATRLATLTLLETKDGYRIASAHFSKPT